MQKLAEFRKRLDKLSPEKRELYERLRKIGPPGEPSTLTLEDNFPASYQQKRLWFLDQLYPDLIAYNVPGALRLKGPLDIHALEASLSMVVRRHSILRSTFSDDGESLQIMEAERVLMPVIKLDVISGENIDTTTQHRLYDFSRKAFDLMTGPLYRFCIFRFDEHLHVFAYCFHHTVFDGFSMSVLYRELEEAYASFRDGGKPQLPTLNCQYSDYVLWQQDQKRRADYQESLGYWQRHLHGELPVLNITGDRPKPPILAHEGARIDVDIESELAEKLAKLASDNKCTFFAVLLAGFAVLLHRYTEDHDIIIGSPTAGRLRTEYETLIGFFVNMLPLRINLCDNPSFRQLLKHTQEVVVGGFSHQHVPLDQVIDEVNIERDLGGNPLFNTILAYRNIPEEKLRLPDIESTWERLDNGTARFDLSLYITRLPDKIYGQLEFNTELFDIETARAMVRHLIILLKDIVLHQDVSVGELNLLDPDEKHLLLNRWNQTTKEYPRNATVIDLLRNTAAEHPERVALECGGQIITYKELDKMTDEMAAKILDVGIKPQQILGVCLKRNAEAVKAMLAVMKTGAVYLPIDPAYPEARRQFILEDSDASALITDSAGVHRLGQIDIQVLNLDDEITIKSQAFTHNKLVSAKDCAYLIYTSGSTGQPKGVEIQHRALTNFLTNAVWDDFIEPTDSLLAVAPMVFDVSLMEILLPLTKGVRLILASDTEMDDPECLATLLVEVGVTIMIATPSAWRRILSVEWQAPNLKAMFAGESMDEEMAANLMGRVNQLWNAYGPTEATILATMRRLNAPSEVNLIGRPMANTETYVLDSQLQPVPVGVVAELCIGGDGLAAGYLGKETLTNKSFAANPFTHRKDARLYRTGDLVRYTRTGDLQYVSRNDNQIKLRGHRIELGEIEAFLNKADGVRATVAAVCEPIHGDRRLVAYIVLEEKALWNPERLRMHLRQHLPGYMVPQHLVQIDAIPLGTSQKVDRDALTKIPLKVDSAENIRVEAATESEKKIYTIWHDLIKGGDFSVTDNIFDLGGDSMMITRIVNALRQVFPGEIEFRWVFDFPTVKDLAARIDQVNSK